MKALVLSLSLLQAFAAGRAHPGIQPCPPEAHVLAKVPGTEDSAQLGRTCP